MSNINDKTVGRGTSEPKRSGTSHKTLMAMMDEPRSLLKHIMSLKIALLTKDTSFHLKARSDWSFGGRRFGVVLQNGLQGKLIEPRSLSKHTKQEGTHGTKMLELFATWLMPCG